MHLNHLNLPVTNLAEARAFFEDLLDFQFLAQAGEHIVALSDGNGFMLVLANAAHFGDGEPPRYPEPFHVGFNLETRAQVDQMYERVAAAGLPLPHRPRYRAFHYSFYFTALDGILFEIASHAGDEGDRGIGLSP